MCLPSVKKLTYIALMAMYLKIQVQQLLLDIVAIGWCTLSKRLLLKLCCAIYYIDLNIFAASQDLA